MRAAGADAASVLPAGSGPAAVEHVVATAQPLVLGAARVAVELDTPAHVRSALLVPIAWGGAVRHVAVLVQRRPRVWDAAQVELAETLARQAALGLARLEAEERRVAQAERDRALVRAAHALNLELDLRAVLETLAREAVRAVGGAYAGVYLLEEDGTAVATAGHGCPDGWLGHRIAPGEGLGGRVLATGEAVVAEDYARDVAPVPGAGDLRAGVGLPMRWSGELRGALSVGFTERRGVSRPELEVLEAIADLAVVACHNAEAYAALRTAASTDALTGLLNHGAMQARVRAEIARATRDGHRLCCLLLDLDDFKRVNDELGHGAGDDFLRRVADALRAEVRPYDQLARYGGDEFVVVLPATDEAEARAVGERIRARVGAAVPAGLGSAPGSCSVGVAAWEDGMTAGELLAAADRALLVAKRTGKGRVAVASPDAQEELDRLRDSGGSPAAVQALVAVIEARDRYSHEHSELVVRLATGVALLLGLPADAVERIGHVALLHDVGKLAVPPALLAKDGTLDDAEWDLVAEHPVLGEGILRRVPELAPLAPLVRHEHEHWDGTGYPDGLAGSQIPTGSRIVLACDAYAAMITARPYRRALAPDAAVAELRAASGTQFDPQVVDALLDLLGAAA